MEDWTPIADLKVDLSEMILWRDWDYGTSMLWSLRHYFWEYGTVPLWNFAMCGGRPEIFNPNSWILAWPSLFAILAPPLWAFILFMLSVATLGGIAFYLLLRRWGGSKIGATTGALLLIFNGFFFSHVNQGHVNFILFLLLPLLILLADRSIDGALNGQSISRDGLALFAATWAYVTAAIPHGLIYGYPVLILYFVLKAGSKVHALRIQKLSTHQRPRSIFPWRAFSRALWPHVFGVIAGLYKLYPAASWQARTPRDGVYPESHQIFDLFPLATRWVTDYREIPRLFERQVWGYWEYNVYIGHGALYAAALGLLLPFFPQVGIAEGGRRDLSPLVPLLGITLVLAGLLLATGPESDWSLTSIFRHLPVLSGVRVYTRYLIVSLIGCTLLVTAGLSAPLWSTLRPLKRRILKMLIAAFVLAPPMTAALQLTRNIHGRTKRSILDQYGLPSNRGLPQNILMRGGDHATSLLDEGYWPRTCYEPLKIPGYTTLQVPMEEGIPTPLLAPMPRDARLKVHSHGLILQGRVDDPAAFMGTTLNTQDVKVEVRSIREGETDGTKTSPANADQGGKWVEIRLTAPIDDFLRGAGLSLLGLLGMIFWWVWERKGSVRT